MTSYIPDNAPITAVVRQSAAKSPRAQGLHQTLHHRPGSREHARSRARSAYALDISGQGARAGRTKTLRWRLFPKYATLVIALVGNMLVASGGISLYFSYRENQQHLVELQREKAQSAATRIGQYIQDIEHQIGWTTLLLTRSASSS